VTSVDVTQARQRAKALCPPLCASARDVLALCDRVEELERERDEALGVRDGEISAVQKVLQERSRVEAAETRVQELEAERAVAVSHLDWAIGFAGTAENEDWRAALVLGLGRARACLGDTP
jgi:hypothetical protein